MIREGVLDATLSYLSDNPDSLAISGYSEGGSKMVDLVFRIGNGQCCRKRTD